MEGVDCTVSTDKYLHGDKNQADVLILKICFLQDYSTLYWAVEHSKTLDFNVPV